MDETARRLAARRRLWEIALADVHWGCSQVLDAGTGEGHATLYLAERRPAALTTVSCARDDLDAARGRLGPRAAGVHFLHADLARLEHVPDDSFDIVLADFLIAAVSAFAPFREIDCLRELLRVLRPGGRLVVTGWECLDPPRDPLAERLTRLFALRDAAARLAGAASYREHPAWWVAARLAEAGAPPERIVRHPDLHRDFRWFGGQIRRLLDGLEPPLRAALAARLAAAEVGLYDHPAFAAGYAFGALHAVVATKLGGAALLDGAR